LKDTEFDFVEVITKDGAMIEVRDTATGKLHSTIEPDLFEHMLLRAWQLVNGERDCPGTES
jgi:hypothetical protein